MAGSMVMFSIDIKVQKMRFIWVILNQKRYYREEKGKPDRNIPH